jgi:hypothetical protein
MFVGILARLIDIEIVMRVFDRLDAEPTREKRRDELDDQRRLAGAAPARKSDNTH